MDLPFVYVRSSPKDHGLENLIEGDLRPGQKVVIIEDLVSTGSSSLKAAQAILNYGGDVLGMVAIFSYGFPQATENFAKAGLELTALSQYDVLIRHAVSSGEIRESDLKKLMQWREDPANWGKGI